MVRHPEANHFPRVHDMSYHITDSVADLLSYLIIQICQTCCHPIAPVASVHVLLSTRGVLRSSSSVSHTHTLSLLSVSKCNVE